MAPMVSKWRRATPTNSEYMQETLSNVLSPLHMVFANTFYPLCRIAMAEHYVCYGSFISAEGKVPQDVSVSIHTEANGWSPTLTRLWFIWTQYGLCANVLVLQ